MKLIAMMMTGLVSSVALAGGGPHEHFPKCQPGESVEQPAPLSVSLQEYLGALGAKVGNNFVGVRLGLQYVGRTIGHSGNCPSRIIKNGQPRLYVSVDIATPNYQFVRRDFAHNGFEAVIQVRRDERGRVNGLQYRNGVSKDDFTLVCDLPEYSPAHSRTSGLLVGNIGGVAIYQKVECQTGLFSSIPESIN